MTRDRRPTRLSANESRPQRLVVTVRERYPGLGLSIGVVDVGGSKDADDAVGRADRCMYAAKNAGKSRVVLQADGTASSAR